MIDLWRNIAAIGLLHNRAVVVRGFRNSGKALDLLGGDSRGGVTPPTTTWPGKMAVRPPCGDSTRY